MKMNAFIAAHMKNRIEYLNSKKLNELTDEEIKEYLAIRKKVREAFGAIKDCFSELTESYREFLYGNGEDEEKG